MPSPQGVTSLEEVELNTDAAPTPQSQGRAMGRDRVLEGFLEEGALELGLQCMSRSLPRIYRTSLWVE